MCVTSAAALPCRAVCSIRPPLEVGDVRQRFDGATGDGHGLVRQGGVRMRLRCCGATCVCIHTLGVQRLNAFTPLACNV